MYFTYSYTKTGVSSDDESPEYGEGVVFEESTWGDLGITIRGTNNAGRGVNNLPS